MAASQRPMANARLLRRLVLATFGAAALYIPLYFLVQLPVFGLQQETIIVILLLFMGMVGLLWLAVWLAALVIAIRRRAGSWIRAFVGLGVLAIAILVYLYIADAPALFVSFVLNLLVLYISSGYYFLAFYSIIVIAVCLLPVPIEAWRYADVLAKKAR